MYVGVPLDRPFDAAHEDGLSPSRVHASKNSVYKKLLILNQELDFYFFLIYDADFALFFLRLARCISADSSACLIRSRDDLYLDHSDCLNSAANS